MAFKKIEWKENLSYEDWLKERNKINGIGESHCRVGASSISVLTGSNKWKSKRRLFLELAGLYSKGFANHRTIQGQQFEASVAELFEYYNTDDEVYFNNFTTKQKERFLNKAEFFGINDEYPNFSASLDYVPFYDCSSPFTGEIYAPNTPIEIKYIDEFVYKSWDDVIPMHYMEQVQVQMAVTGTELAVFVPMTNDGVLHPVEIERNQSLIDYLSYEAGVFAKEVTKAKILKAKIDLTEDKVEKHDLEVELEELIPFDDVEDIVDLMNETKEEGEEFKEVPTGSEEDGWMEEYQECTEKEKDLKSRKTELRSRLMASSEGFAGVESPDYKCTARGNNHESKGSYFRVNSKNK